MSVVDIPSDLLDLYTNAPLLELGAAADRMRREKHPHGVVSYIVDRNINYTNVCVADCGFCAFYRRPKHREGYTLSYEQIGAKIEETKALGGVQILIQGGHNPYIPFEWYLDLLRYIKRNHPIHIHGFSPSEVDFFSQVFRMDARDVVRELKAAGLDSIPGGGGEILVQRVRDYAAPGKAGESGTVREFMGGRMHAIYLRSPELYGLIRGGRAWMYWTINRQRRALMAAIEGEGEFVFSAQLRPGEEAPTGCCPPNSKPAMVTSVARSCACPRS